MVSAAQVVCVCVCVWRLGWGGVRGCARVRNDTVQKLIDLYSLTVAQVTLKSFEENNFYQKGLI
jgi:hypothetical protein